MAAMVRTIGKWGAHGVCVIAMVCLAACASAPSGSRYLRVAAKGSAVPSAEATLRPPSSPVSGQGPATSWARQTLTAEATTPIPDDVPGKVNAVLLARRRAHTRALEQLAAQVADLPARGDRRVKDILASNKALLEAVETAIRASNRIDAGNMTAKESYTVRVTLPLDKIAEVLGDAASGSSDRTRVFGGGDDRDATGSTDLPSDEKEARKMAYATALRNARIRLLDAVRREQLDNGRTIGDIMDADPQAKAFVAERITDAKVIGEAYPLPTDCHLEIRFDLDRLKRRLRTRY